MSKKYGYMIKTVDKNMRGYNGFKYPKKGKVVAPDWDPAPICGGGIHGLIHETEEHYIENNDIWLVLKYEKGTEVVIDNNKIKVPYAWIIFAGTAEEAQKKFKELTGKEYQYDYTIQTAGYKSIQKAENWSTQIAGYKSTQIAGNWSTQKAEYESTQKAGIWSIQKAGNRSIQIGESGSTQIAEFESTQIAEYKSTQTAGCKSIQKAGSKSTQKAREGSICIIDGKEGYCQHKGKVLQILRFYDDKKDEYVFLYTIIKNNKRYKLKAIETTKGWKLEKKEVKEDGNN